MIAGMLIVGLSVGTSDVRVRINRWNNGCLSNSEQSSRRAFVRLERSELNSSECVNGKVIYNDIYFQQKIALTNCLPFSSRKLLPVVGRTELGGLDYTARHKIWVSLISVTKWQETSINKCHEHILLIIFIIYYWFTYIFIYWYSFFNDAVKDFWRDYR